MSKIDAYSLVGKSTNEASIRDLLNFCKIATTPTIGAGEIEARFAVKEKGIDLNFVSAQTFDATSLATDVVLSNFLFFGAEYRKYGYSLYEGELPSGLSFTMKQEKVVAILGLPEKTWKDDDIIESQRWIVKGNHVLVQYSYSTQAVKSIEVAIPKPGI